MSKQEGSHRPSEHEPLSDRERAVKAASLLEGLRDSLSQTQEFRDAVVDIFGDRSDHPVDQFFSQDPDQRDAFFGSTHSGAEFEKDGFTYFVDYVADSPLKIPKGMTLIELRDRGIAPERHEGKINLGFIVERTKAGDNRPESLLVSLTKDSSSGTEKGIFAYGRNYNTQSAANKISEVITTLKSGK